MTTNTLLLIDGHSMAFRSFYALAAPNFRTTRGQYTNAIHGFTMTLLRLMKDHRPDHVAVAFDLPGGTFRTREYPQYKAGRSATPVEFSGQIEGIQHVLESLGIKWFSYPDYEADDIVATLSTQACAAGMNVVIASGDRDAFQLVGEHITLMYPKSGTTLIPMDAKAVLEKTGVTPQMYPDMAALVGEDADNIPGVPLWGPKTAAKWLNHYGSLAALLDHCEEISGKAGANLHANVELVRRNRELNALVCDLPLVDDLAELRISGGGPAQVRRVFSEYEFVGLQRRVLSEFPFALSADSSEGISDALDGESGNERDDLTADKEELIAQILTGGQVALAQFLAEHPAPYGLYATGQQRPRKGNVDTVAIAGADKVVFCADRASLSPEDEETLREFLVGDTPKIGHATKGLWHAWHGVGYDLAGMIADIELAAYVLAPSQRDYSLENLASRYLGIELTADESDQLFSLTGNSYQGAAERAAVLHPLYGYCQRALAAIDAVDLASLELVTAQLLAQMEDRGIAVDEAVLESLYETFNVHVEDAQRRAWDAIGDDSVNLSSPKQLQEVLFERLELPKTKKTKSGYTTNAAALGDLLRKIALREDDKSVAGQEFLSALLLHRDAIKLRQSIDGLRRAVESDKRIHTTYQQAVTETGRLSSTDPNLQNIHARTEEGLQVREVFVPGQEFDYLMTADYSQIEMRLMAHFSGDEELIAAFRDGVDLHRYVASRIFNVPPEEVTSQQRSHIKAVSYGLAYGLSAYGLSSQLHISVPEAERLMADYFTRFGRIRDYLHEVVEQARQDGFTATITGRRRYLPELTSMNRMERETAERRALNAPIQGSAADIIKLAMIRVDEAMTQRAMASRMLLQVHDELVFEVVAAEAQELEALVRAEMGNAVELRVPLEVSVGIGRNWRAAAH
ncbi:DNA polymerase I [Trueperella sp. LYQ143]|uniref:DNA polymerase I n=1 Tax=Trueperella sp. LYQ143 TaxID=3391059 RepID=UPI00398389F9